MSAALVFSLQKLRLTGFAFVSDYFDVIFWTFIVTYSALPDYTVCSFAGNLINPPLVQRASRGPRLEAPQRETNMDEDQSI